jgi:hypothetical protein
MKRYLLALLLIVHTALVFMHFGAGLMDVLIFFPNWFHNMPDSLAAAKQFSSYRNPGMFFIPMTLLVILSGAAFAAAAWRSGSARVWVLIDIVLFAAIGVLTGAFIYPRIYAVMGDAPLTLEAMQQIAAEMTILIQVRIVIVAIAAALAAFALWRFVGSVPKPVEITKGENNLDQRS